MRRVEGTSTTLQIDRVQWLGLLKRLAHFRSDCSDEEDLLHSAFLRFARYRENHAVDDPEAFLMQTAIRIAIDTQRQERFREPTDTAWLRQRADESPLQDETMVTCARLERVREGLKRLPPRTKEILLMNRIDGRRQKEIAAHFGISRSAVEKHIAKAMIFLTEWTEGW